MNKKINSLVSDEITVLHMFSRFSVGGAEKLLLELIKNARQDKNINYIFLSLKDTVDEKFIEELKSLNIKFFIWNKKEYKNPLRIFELLKLINREKIDIIHTHESGAKHLSMICRLFKPGLKLVFTSHGNNDLAEIEQSKVFIYNLFLDKIIMISDPIKATCKRIGLTKTELIYNGIDTKKFNKAPERKFTEDVLNIINVSRLEPLIKGQDILIKALKICRDRGLDFKCNFVGGVYDYAPDALNELERLVKQNRLEEKIKFLGNRNDIPELLAESDLFILASRIEAMPLVLLEAMASGLPVISSDIPGAKALIDDGDNGILFESENPEDLADKIHELHRNREKMKQTAETGFKFVQNFDISLMTRKYHDLYKSI